MKNKEVCHTELSCQSYDPDHLGFCIQETDGLIEILRGILGIWALTMRGPLSRKNCLEIVYNLCLEAF